MTDKCPKVGFCPAWAYARAMRGEDRIKYLSEIKIPVKDSNSNRVEINASALPDLTVFALGNTCGNPKFYKSCELNK